MPAPDWFFGRWAPFHVELIRRGDWPPFDAVFWDELWRVFDRRGVTEVVAFEASRLLFLDPPAFLQDYPARLMDKVRRVWRESEVPSVSRSTPADPRFDRDCEAHWQLLAEPERDEVRRLVRERAPFLAGLPRAQEKLARAWAYEPELVIAPPPQPERREPPARKGPRRLFQE